MKIVKVVFEKVGEGRGRPSKFYELEDGTKVPWRQFGADHPEIVQEFQNKHVTKDLPNVAIVESDMKQQVQDTVKETTKEKETVELGGLKGKMVEVEGTVATRTVFGTPVNMVHCLGNPSNGIDLVKVLVSAKTNREYVTSVSSRDLVRPEGELPEEFKELKYARE